MPADCDLLSRLAGVCAAPDRALITSSEQSGKPLRSYRRLCALWRSTELLAGARQIDRVMRAPPRMALECQLASGAFKSGSGKAMFQRHANIIRGTGGRRAGLRPP